MRTCETGKQTNFANIDTCQCQLWAATSGGKPDSGTLSHSGVLLGFAFLFSVFPVQPRGVSIIFELCFFCLTSLRVLPPRSSSDTLKLSSHSVCSAATIQPCAETSRIPSTLLVLLLPFYLLQLSVCLSDSLSRLSLF